MIFKYGPLLVGLILCAAMIYYSRTVEGHCRDSGGVVVRGLWKPICVEGIKEKQDE